MNIDDICYNDDEIISKINPSNKNIYIRMKDDRYIDEDEILRTIIIIDLPNVDDVIDTITNIFVKYGKIDRIIIDKNEKTTDALIIYSNILSTEKAQFYPEVY